MDSILDTNAPKERGGFWVRQFGAYSRPSQFIFDVVFGILMPLLCFYLDPGIIRGNFSTPLQHVMGLPAFAQWGANEIVRRSMTEILNADRDASDTAVQRIKHLHWIVDTGRIVREYERESDGARRERLGEAYKEITGEEIEIRLRILND